MRGMQLAPARAVGARGSATKRRAVDKTRLYKGHATSSAPQRCYSGARSAPEIQPDEESVSTPNSASWYACYTRARHEKRVDGRLCERGFDSYLPLVPRQRQWHDRKKVVHFPLFPSYVFVRTPLRDVTGVLGTPGVSTVVRFNGRPVSIPDEEIANVRRLTLALARANQVGVEAGPTVDEGERIRVGSGPFEGIEGIVLELRGRDRAVIQVGLRTIRLGIKVEVEAAALRRLG